MALSKMCFFFFFHNLPDVIKGSILEAPQPHHQRVRAMFWLHFVVHLHIYNWTVITFSTDEIKKIYVCCCWLGRAIERKWFCRWIGSLFSVFCILMSLSESAPGAGRHFLFFSPRPPFPVLVSLLHRQVSFSITTIFFAQVLVLFQDGPEVQL